MDKSEKLYQKNMRNHAKACEENNNWQGAIDAWRELGEDNEVEICSTILTAIEKGDAYRERIAILVGRRELNLMTKEQCDRESREIWKEMYE